jgi:ADP-ribosylglycohydrolase
MNIEKIHACLFLSIIGDKIGFENGNREFYLLDQIPKYNSSQFKTKVIELSLFMLLEFIKNGGISGINTNDLIYSDDSIMLIANTEIFLDNYKNLKDYLNKLLNRYIKDFENESIMRNKYKAGVHTMNTIRLLKNNSNWKKREYEKGGGGSGGSMRSSIYGIIFDYKTQLKKLIKYSIYSCMITHMNGIAIIGSVLNSLITSYALNNIDIEKWLFFSLNIIKNNYIDDIIEKKFKHIYDNYLKDKSIYIDSIELYLEQNFNNEKYKYDIIRELNPGDRILYYYDNFSYKESFFPGSNSKDSIIIAYDCLLMARDNYEKLIYYSMIHLGDSDTTGIIASGWYGAYYGFNKKYDYLYINDEYYDFIKQISNNIIKKYKNI